MLKTAKTGISSFKAQGRTKSAIFISCIWEQQSCKRNFPLVQVSETFPFSVQVNDKLTRSKSSVKLMDVLSSQLLSDLTDLLPHALQL